MSALSSPPIRRIRPNARKTVRAIAVAGLLCMAGIETRSAEPRAKLDESRDVSEMTLEQLLEVKVVSMSKKEEEWSRAPGAIHVISGDDIRRSGFSSLPEALRLSPGLHVARVDSHQWAISSRGFNDVFANKLLVMIDGRSVYTPLFSGVYWDVQDTFLEDIDRIEVIRGPGATLWGANAVNGVINVITKSARDTQGTVLQGGGGTEERVFGGVRYGGRAGPESDLFYRVYAKYFDRDASVLPDGSSADDRWRMQRGGFRLDWDVSDENSATFQGDVYAGTLGQQYRRLSPVPPFNTFLNNDDIDVSGGNLLGRWTHQFSSESELSLQSYYDRTTREAVLFQEDRDTFDFDFQHRFPVGERQEIMWGGGYRLTSDDVRNSFDVALQPHDRTSKQLFSAFIQDEIAVLPDRVSLTIGSKFEHNDFTGFEVQPSARLLWTPERRHTVWASVSRAVRTPSRAEADLRLNQPPVFPQGALFPPNPLAPGGSPTALSSIFGSDDFGSEELIAYELGYRIQPHDRLSFDLAVFYNDYDEIRGLQPGTPLFRFASGHPGVPPPHVALIIENPLAGETYGGEFSMTWHATDWWRIHAGYSLLEIQMHPDDGMDANAERNLETNSPHHQLFVRSSIDLPHNWQWDLGLRYVDELEGLGVDSYWVMDIRLAWQPFENLELAIVGLNLLDNQHPEFTPTVIATQQTEVQHSVYGIVTWRF